MKFSMKGSNLVDSLEKMHKIATRGIKPEYELAGCVTIETLPDRVLFRTSNGNLDASWEITKETDATVVGGEPGIVTADVSILRAVAKVAGSSDNIVTVNMDKNVVLIKDETTKNKKQAKIETFHRHHDFKIKKPSKGFSYTFDSAIFQNGVTVVGKYVSNLAHKIKYHMICTHFLKDEVRFICGNGMRFGILFYKVDNQKIEWPTPDDERTGIKYIMPADQALIIASVLGDAQKLTIVYESDTSCFINPMNGMEMHLKGIPHIPYIAYETHAIGREDAVEAIVDIKAQDFVSGVALVSAVRDKAIEKDKEGFHSAKFKCGMNQEFELAVNEGRYQCDYLCSAKYTKVKDKSFFASEYAAAFLSDVAESCSGKDIVRFSCIDEFETILVEPMCENGSDNPRLLFFFASASERTDNSAAQAD